MPANKKKDTIPQRNGATSNGVLPTHQPLLEDFHQYVRSEIRHATRMVNVPLSARAIVMGSTHGI